MDGFGPRPSQVEASGVTDPDSLTLLDAAPTPIWVSDSSKAGVWFNKAWLDYAGRALEEEQGEGWLTRIHPDDVDRSTRICAEAFEARRPFKMELRLKRADGEYRWFEDAGAPRFGPDGAFTGFIGTCTDVTERKTVEFALRTTRERLRLAQEAGGVGVWDYDVSDGRLHWTVEQKRLFGLDGEAAPPDFPTFLSYVHPDDREKLQAASARAFETGSYDVEFRGAALDGSPVERTFIARGQVVRDQDGKPTRVVGVNLDVTSRRKAERAVEESEARFRGVFDSGIAGMALHRVADGAALAANDRLLQMTGHDRADVAAGRWTWGTVADEDLARLDGRQVREGELLRRDGSRLPVRVSAAPSPDEPGVLILAVEDVSERRRTDLHRSILIDLSRILVDGADDAELFGNVCELVGSRLGGAGCAFFDMDTAANEMRFHPAYVAPGRRPPPSTLPLDQFDPLAAELDQGRIALVEDAQADPRLEERYREAFAATGTGAFLTAPLRREGRTVSCFSLISAEPRRWSADEIELIRVVAERTWLAVENRRLATERDRSLAALQASEAELRALADERTRERNRVFELSHELIAVTGHDRYLRAVNPAWSRLLGWTEAELLGRPVLEFAHAEDMKMALASARALGRGDSLERFEARARHKDGSWRWISWTAVPEGDLVYSVGRDITAEREASDALRQANARLEAEILERERVQEQLLQAQKMEALGQLTGGVAHDFNNLLQVIVGALALVEQSEPARRARLLEAMRQAAGRGEGLTRQLLAFSRRSALKPEVIRLPARLEAMSELLDRSLRGDVTVETRLAEDLPPVEVDAGEFELAVLNIAVNARDAMPDGGVLSITGEEVERLDDGDLTGRFVRLQFSDTGQGMNAETLARVFEPFFTTKEVGKGSGLGLSQVYGFAQQSGGGVRVDSEPGLGTTVSLYLPLAAAQEAPARPKRRPISRTAREGCRVLLVEDDDAVAELACEMLAELGFSCARVDRAAAALARLRNDPSLAAVLSDVMMPGGLSGLDLARDIRALRPDLPVVLATGFSAAAAVARHEGFEVLAKPYRLETLEEALSSAIEASAA
jgi:PAS domain S-box-containing protein